MRPYGPGRLMARPGAAGAPAPGETNPARIRLIFAGRADIGPSPPRSRESRPAAPAPGPARGPGRCGYRPATPRRRARPLPARHQLQHPELLGLLQPLCGGEQPDQAAAVGLDGSGALGEHFQQAEEGQRKVPRPAGGPPDGRSAPR